MPALRFRSIARVSAVAIASVLAAGLLTSCASEPDAIHPTAPATKGKETPKPVAPKAEDPPASPEVSAPEEPAAPESPAFDRAAHSLDDPNSIWVIANKLRPLTPQTYTPGDLVVPNVRNTNGQPLRQVAAGATEQMVAAAAADGVAIHLVSAFRDYDTQVSIYGSFVANQGQAFADTTSARPGHSEHQTGLTADFAGDDACTLDTCFADTAAGQWLQKYAADFGFTMRYPDGYEGITGYFFEPWHYRYVGVELAQEVKAQGMQTLEEFFGLPAAADYAG
ncbi:M15 family metallopeptidase [Leucobacter sp. BZR 635]